jgi:hypothetical protein
MPSVNDDGTIHASFIEGGIRFWPYDGGASRATLKRAINIIQKNIFGKNVSCNSYFSHLPGGRSFDDIWRDPAFWINWDNRPNPGFYGATSSANPTEITISQFALNKGAWVTVATIVHEMAHVNGAPGGSSTAAEDSLPRCGLKGLVDPGAVGWRQPTEDDSDSRVV